MPSQFTINAYTGALSYKQYDTVGGIDLAGTIHASPYFYATQDITPGGYSPSGVYNFPVTSFRREDDIVTLNYTHSGGPPFAVGSIVRVTGTFVNFTGMAVVGGSGAVSYVLAGQPTTGTNMAGAINCHTPAWSTGFFFVPDYTSKMPTKNEPIITRLGGNYTQRMPKGLNTFSANPVLVYRNIPKREAKAIINFVQNAEGVGGFQILMPDPYLANNASHRFIGLDAEMEPVSFERYNGVVMLERVFDSV